MVLPKELYDEIYSQVPRICVEILIKTDNGFVLSKRLIPPCVDMWHIPGGTVYLRERLDDAARRIALEELGVKINVFRIIGIINYLKIFDKTNSKLLSKEHGVGIVFLCRLDSPGSFKGSFQAEEIKIFNTDNIPDNTILTHKDFIQRYNFMSFEYIEDEDDK